MEKSKNRPRAILGALGMAALALTLSRCSPVSPNIHKSTYDDSPSARAGDSSAKTLDFSNVSFVHIFTYVSKVMDVESYRSALQTEQFPATNRITVSPGATPVAFADFARTGRLVVEWHGEIPLAAQALFAVSLNRSEIQEEELFNFETTLVSLGDDRWMVSVSPAIDASMWERVRDNLVEITLLFKTKSSQSPIEQPSPTETGPGATAPTGGTPAEQPAASGLDERA